MIFVTLGTQDKQFVRLIEAVNKIDTDEQIVAQVGSTNCSKLKLRDNIKIYDYLSDNEFDKYMNNARIIITHAGVGTIIKGLKLNKTMIVAARLKKYKEHVNDHQLQILDNFSKEGYIIPLHNFEDLPSDILEMILDKGYTREVYDIIVKQYVVRKYVCL